MVVYLLHFDRSLKHAKHSLGSWRAVMDAWVRP